MPGNKVAPNTNLVVWPPSKYFMDLVRKRETADILPHFQIICPKHLSSNRQCDTVANQ